MTTGEGCQKDNTGKTLKQIDDEERIKRGDQVRGGREVNEVIQRAMEGKYGCKKREPHVVDAII